MITLAALKARFRYDPLTGIFTYRCGQKRRAGKVAGTITNGHIQICIDYKHYYAHRLAWLYHYGIWPPDQIDHKDRNGLNNKIDNLRLASNRENMCNIGKTNVSNGLPKGVFKTSKGKFGAKISLLNKQLYLGYFATAQEAGEAYKQASLKYHGQFSPFR